MKVSVIDTSNLKTYEDFSRFAARLFGEIQSILNSGILFTDNVNCRILGVNFAASNTEVPVAHGLSKVPTGYILINASAAMSVYDSGSTNTDVTLYLKSNAVGSCNLLVF